MPVKSMDKFTIKYELEDAGWAQASIDFQGDSVQMTASYLHDTLRELAEAAISIVNGAKTARVVFMDEPGEHQLLLCRLSDDKIEFEVRWFDDWESWGMLPADKYDVRLQGSTTIRRFRHEVLNVLWKIFEEYGAENYKEKWIEHEFPLNKYEELKEA
jgi:hypothetical protein